MRLGGLFSGIGGFELAWQRAGGTVAWMCESDPAARRVLEAHFPGVPIYPDIAALDPDGLPPVEVIAGGSPCQGFSIAGTRTGMRHTESRLFADYIRIMNGLEARGLRWAVWENVPGVLSIANDDGERTFEHVVAAFSEQMSLFDSTTASGGTRVWLLEDRVASPGASSTADTSECPNDADVCTPSSLSDVLAPIGPTEPYWLSPRACRGILRRAAGRGKQLPAPLRAALEAVSHAT